MPSISRAEAATHATGRTAPLFSDDLNARNAEIGRELSGQRVLVIGGAGSIGAATVEELARFRLAALHVIDLSENGLAELVRDLRGRSEGLDIPDFRTLPLDFGSPTMLRFLRDQAPYGYVLNFAAIKHVRSEKDSYSILQMLDTNVLKASRLLDWLTDRGGTQRYFSVSTDKAANPVNLMGASKRLMEQVVFANSNSAGGFVVTSARFANVAFSDGSLLAGWLNRLEKGQPIAVPRGTRRYFISLREAGQLCLLAAVCAPAQHLVVPRLDAETQLIDLEHIARSLLDKIGFTPAVYEGEHEARTAVAADLANSRYPLLLTPLDTSGEKPYEEFLGQNESLVDLGWPNLMGIRYTGPDRETLMPFMKWLSALVAGDGPCPDKRDFISALGEVVPELRHAESGKQLDHRL